LGTTLSYIYLTDKFANARDGLRITFVDAAVAAYIPYTCQMANAPLIVR
jgi:hypothetical protein